MSINPLSSAGPASISGAGTTPKLGEGFGQLMKAKTQPVGSPRPELVQPGAPRSPAEAHSPTQAVAGKGRIEAGRAAVSEPSAIQVLDRVSQAQNRMEEVLKLAESGKAFSPAELLSLQAHVYRASQELDLAGKVVEKATGGVKQVLQTQV
jgi:hypothetical protein